MEPDSASERFPVRPVVTSFAPYTPGRSIQEIREAYQLTQVIKLASNENPLGTSPLVQRRISRDASLAFRYPRPGSPDLVHSLANSLGLDSGRLIAGNGSDEIIDLLLRVVGRPGESNVVLLEPSFSIYRMQAGLNGLDIRRVPLNSDFSFPWSELEHTVDEKTACLFLTSPDNPSGYTAGPEEILSLARRLPRGTLLVLDEAYIDFAEDPEETSPLSRLQETDNLVLLRTFSKLYGLAGLRLGYGIMPPWLAGLIQRIKLPFSVNILAERAGIAALEDTTFRDLTRETVISQRKIMERSLTESGCLVYPSQANFLMFQPPGNARTLYQRLLEKGIIIRPLDSYGLPDHLRVTVGREDENGVFLRELRSILSGTA
ncbi:MAG: histidinol-phosphate transaminase [Desulfohalobiaceae bacterium]|nr:histidinol-phosphate transaminase [Desulfohalobiaceae bacterium]